jgi:hypothetical protein
VKDPQAVITASVFLVESSLNIESIRCRCRNKTAVNFSDQTNFIAWFVKSAKRKCSTTANVGLSGNIEDSFTLITDCKRRTEAIETTISLAADRRTGSIVELTS